MSARALMAHSSSDGLLERLLPRFGEGLLTVAYHRVGDASTSPFDQGLFSATEEAFEAHVRLFKQRFDIVSPDDLPRIRGARGRYLHITFDDGYRDNYEVAFPVLARHGVPATFFLATGLVDAPRVPWWDELSWMILRSRRAALPRGPWLPEPLSLEGPLARREALRRLKAIHACAALADDGPLLDWLGEATGSGRCGAEQARGLWMTWDMVREMHRRGMSFGAHTVRHLELSRLPREAQAEEIASSVRRVEEETGAPVTVFAYPYGWPTSFDEDTRSCLRAAGIAFAYTFYGGHQTTHGWDPYALRRVAMEPDVGRASIAAMSAIPRWFARPWHEPLLGLGRLKARLTGRPTGAEAFGYGWVRGAGGRDRAARS